MTENLYVTEGRQRNLIVYDELAGGRFTRRLVAVMKTIARRTLRSRLRFLFVPDAAAVEHGTVILGVLMIHQWMDLREQYLSEGGVFRDSLEELVVGVTYDNQSLLGCF